MRLVAINLNQLGLNLEPSVHAGVTCRQVGQIRPAAAVEGGGGAEFRHPVGDVLHTGTYVRSNHELLRIKARRGEVVGQGERGELGLKIVETGLGGGEVREIKEGGLFEVLSEWDCKEAEESCATWAFAVDAGVALWDEVVAVWGVPWDSENVVEVHGTCGGVGGLRESGGGGDREETESRQQAQSPAEVAAVAHVC